MRQHTTISGHYDLIPNNTYYDNAFKSVFILFSEDSTNLIVLTYTRNAFMLDRFSGGVCSAIVNVYNRVVMWDSSTNVGFEGASGTRRLGTSRWLDKSTPWTSLGTMYCNSTGGLILVRRLA
jgi:hypothetical protein